MITGLHGMFYSSDPDATRAFLRDKLKLPFKDVGGGWLIFDIPRAELGAHPADAHQAGGNGGVGAHDLSLVCDDIKATLRDLQSRGVALDANIDHRRYGSVVKLTIPGGIHVELYQPKY